MSTQVRPYEPWHQAGVEWLYTRTPPAGRTYVRPQPVPKDLRAIEAHFLQCFVAIEDTIDGTR